MGNSTIGTSRPPLFITTTSKRFWVYVFEKCYEKKNIMKSVILWLKGLFYKSSRFMWLVWSHCRSKLAKIFQKSPLDYHSNPVTSRNSSDRALSSVFFFFFFLHNVINWSKIKVERIASGFQFKGLPIRTFINHMKNIFYSTFRRFHVF